MKPDPATPWEGTPSGMAAQDSVLLRGLAGLHLCYGRHSAAESLLDLALWLDPGDTSAHVLMARVLARQKRSAEAKAHIGMARRGRANF